jgi:hypothetical protein
MGFPEGVVRHFPDLFTDKWNVFEVLKHGDTQVNDGHQQYRAEEINKNSENILGHIFSLFFYSISGMRSQIKNIYRGIRCGADEALNSLAGC